MSVTQDPSLRLFFTLLLHSHRHLLRASVAQSGELPMGSCARAGLCGVPATWEMISEVLHEREGPAVSHKLHGKGRGPGGLLVKLLREVSVEMLAFISIAIFPLQVKMWVQLLIPRIEDGNNFGVSIQVRHRRLYALPQERAALQGRGSLGFL